MSELSGEKIMSLFWDKGWDIGGTYTHSGDSRDYFEVSIEGTHVWVGPVWAQDSDSWCMDSDDVLVLAPEAEIFHLFDLNQEEDLVAALEDIFE